MNETQHLDDEIELSELFKLLKMNRTLIVSVTLIFTIIGFLFTQFLIKPEYQSSATLIVNNRHAESQNITSDEIRSAQNLASVYSIIIKSDTVLEEVIQEHQLDMSIDELSKRISVSSVDNTQVIEISSKTYDPKISQKITNSIVNIAPEFIIDMVEAGSVKVISEASFEEKPVSPNLKMNTLVSMILGLMLSTAYVLMNHMLDRRIKSEKEIERYLELPVIGIIPNENKLEGHSNV